MSIIDPTHLTTGGSTGNFLSYPTASITPTANRLILAAVASSSSGSQEVPTTSGCGLTWTQVATVENPSGSVRITLFRAIGPAPTSGAVTFNFGATSQLRCVWSIAEFADIDGDDPIEQFKTASANTGTAGTADFDAAFGDATNNATYSAVAISFPEAITHEAGFTELGETSLAEALSIESMFLAGEDQTPRPTWTTSVPWVQIAVEIKGGAPDAPTALTAAAVSADRILLTWTDPVPEPSGIKIYRSLTGVGSWMLVDQEDTGVGSHQDVELDPNTEYFYQVRAYNTAGDSLPSSVVDATTLNTATLGIVIGNCWGGASNVTLTVTLDSGSIVEIEDQDAVITADDSVVVNYLKGFYTWTLVPGLGFEAAGDTSGWFPVCPIVRVASKPLTSSSLT